jgi:hypothetical protein
MLATYHGLGQSGFLGCVVVVVGVAVVVSALILCSRLADRASHPICMLTPLDVVVCFSLRASHTFSHTVLQ